MSERNVEAELGLEEKTNKTAFLIKNSLRLSRMLNILLYFQKYFESANNTVSFIKMVIMF